MDSLQFQDSIKRHLWADYGKNLEHASEHEFWTALSRSLMELIAPRWENSREHYQKKRQVHYFSAEFLLGRSLINNLVNLGLYDEVKSLVQAMGFDLDRLEEEEIDPGLGNGGLGRLAACFLDSCATENLAVTGYGILYRYGLFRQSLEDGFQKEYPDSWMELPYPFNCRRDDERVLIRYEDLEVYATPYDIPITAYGTQNVNVLRLWRPEPAEQFDFNLFNSQRFDDAVIQRNRVNDIHRVLYPNDVSYDGKVLRVRQQYFFVSASLQSILRHYQEEHGDDWSKFAELNVMHLNDTHPVLAIPELLRLLIDEHHLTWEQAWSICVACFAYTNHTIMSEALEKWDVSIFQFLFPRIMEICQLIDRQFRQEARIAGLQAQEIEYLSPVHDAKVHMAWLACYASFSVNGVAEIHSNILKRETLKGFYQLWPQRFSNKTNGVTPRRWLRLCNPRLAGLLTELSGSDAWVKDLTRLEELLKFRDDASVLKELCAIKAANKNQLARLIQNRNGIQLNPDNLFDVQVKRLHEYKRQLLNAFLILDEYKRLKANPQEKKVPVTYLFAGKAAPGYYRAKGIIKFINEVARLVNTDPVVSKQMQVYFLPNYNVSLAERIFPAADVSEQISTVGKEASGTSNMKFMMNGALTLGTWDGANLEIVDAVGEDNAFMFGAKIEDFPSTLDYYNSRWQYEHVTGLKEVLDSLIDGSLSDEGSNHFRDLYQSLLQGSSWEKGDIYYLLGDFDAYRRCRELCHLAYLDQEAWARRCWTNICLSSRFSSDRSIREYAQGIWKIESSAIELS